MRWLDGITDTTDMNLGKFPEMVGDGGFEELDMTWRLNNKQHIGPPDTEVPSSSLFCHPCVGFSPQDWSPNGSRRSRRHIQIHFVSLVGIVAHDSSPTSDSFPWAQ